MAVLHTVIDHLVIAAFRLADGIRYVHEILGVMPEPGGEHPKMGTHNYLLNLGGAVYLEIIAVNPQAPNPGRLRFFQLDAFTENTPPRLVTWIARTGNVRQVVDTGALPWGNIEPMSRQNNHWLLTVPEDGSMPFAGVAPSLIEWQTTYHPCAVLPVSGCEFLRLEGFHPQHREIDNGLRKIGLTGSFRVQAPYAQNVPELVAYIQTPGGLKVLR